MTVLQTASRVGAAILLSLPQMLVAQATPVSRPIPYPVVPSLEFQLAIENGTRTEEHPEMTIGVAQQANPWHKSLR